MDNILLRYLEIKFRNFFYKCMLCSQKKTPETVNYKKEYKKYLCLYLSCDNVNLENIHPTRLKCK